jgi:hypothetical protein
MSGDGCYGLRARLMNRLLHLIYDPIPVSDGLHRDGAASRQASQECPVRFSIMIHSLCQFPVSRFIHNDKQRIFLVRITTDKMSHAATPPMVLTERGIWYPPIGVGSAFIQSSWGVNPLTLDVKAAMALFG